MTRFARPTLTALTALTTAGLLLGTAACGSGSSTDDDSPQGGGSSSTSGLKRRTIRVTVKDAIASGTAGVSMVAVLMISTFSPSAGSA